MSSLGIKHQLRITTLIPVLLVALLFAVFYNGQYSHDLKQHTSHLGEAYVRQLLPAAQLAILRGDNRILQGLIDASTVNTEIQSLAFYNARGQLLAYRGGKHLLKTTFNLPGYTGDYVESKQISPFTINFSAPITLPKFNLYSTSTLIPLVNPVALHADDIIGWLSLDVDTKAMMIKQYQMYIVTIFIVLFGLLISLGVHYFLSKRIYQPIIRLRRSMKQILSNEFETTIKHSSSTELGIIEEGCLHLQQAYLNIIKELNQHIEIATHDLQQSLELLEEKNIELSLDRKKAEEKSKQKSEFIANMSHEIRTPMNGVIGFTNVLLESKLDPLQYDYVKTIKSSAQDLLTIINDILDYSKMDAGKLHLDYIPVDIRACLDEVVALIAPFAHKKGIDIIPSTAPSVPKTVLGDPIRLKQIMSNLASNAVKFTEQGYVLIRTEITEESEKDYTLSFVISDTGVGISAEDQSSLFSAFTQADTSITRRFGGSGLGLIICKKLVEQMHGRITLTSELNRGTTFSVQVKLEKLTAYEIDKHQTHPFANLTIICFDDNPLYLEALCNGLSVWGIECIQVNHFTHLEEAFITYPHANMAFISVNQGCEEQVAAVIRKQSIPCIIVSKWLYNYETLGGHGFLFKPPNIQKLHDTLESVLNFASKSQASHFELDELRSALQQIKPKLLIAEDNPVNRMLLQSLFSHNTIFEAVNDGEQAVIASDAKRFHVILLDLQMPKMNGLEAAQRIREKSLLNQNTPIILISANNHDLDNQALQKLGVQLWLQKPIDEKLLISHLISLIKSNQTSAINWGLCVQKVSGNQELAKEFLDKFIEELHNNREEFIQLMHQNNIAQLEHLAHKLHGACCFCGVPQLQSQVAEFESAARRVDNIEMLQSAYTLLIQQIDAVLNDYQHMYLAA